MLNNLVVTILVVTSAGFHLSESAGIAASNPIQGSCAYADFTYSPNGVATVAGARNKRDISSYLFDTLVNKRVVNGQPIGDINNWPWLVAILAPENSGAISSQGRRWDLNCGGTLIHPQFVLTAAHCVIETNDDETSYTRKSAKDFLIRIGDYNLNLDDKAFTDIGVDQTFTHPDYNPLNVDVGNDLALLHLVTPYQSSAADPLRVACLPDQVVPAGSTCVVAGWGSTSTDSDTSPIPLYTTLKVTSWSACQTTYQFETSDSADGRMFCAGPPSRTATDTCSGDSGGAIFCKDATVANAMWQLSGLVSFGGEKCAPRNLAPGVYTNIAYTKYKSWIQSTINTVVSNPGYVQPTVQPVVVTTTPYYPYWQVPTQAVTGGSWWQGGGGGSGGWTSRPRPTKPSWGSGGGSDWGGSNWGNGGGRLPTKPPKQGGSWSPGAGGGSPSWDRSDDWGSSWGGGKGGYGGYGGRWH